MSTMKLYVKGVTFNSDNSSGGGVGTEQLNEIIQDVGILKNEYQQIVEGVTNTAVAVGVASEEIDAINDIKLPGLQNDIAEVSIRVTALEQGGGGSGITEEQVSSLINAAINGALEGEY